MKKRDKRSISLQVKISSIYILVSLLVILVDLVLLVGINRMSNRLERAYQDNLSLNALTEALGGVQDSMTDYLKVKTTDALEDYYRKEQEYRNLIEDLHTEVTGLSLDRMERSIRYMSESYLDQVGETVEAKRGRNVEKYRQYYEKASQLYRYINYYITKLNMDKFKTNSQQYSQLLRDFHLFQTASLVVIFLLVGVNASIIVRFVGNLIGPLKRLAGSANEVARGNFEIDQIPVESGDEIGIVTGAFNQMILSIRLYIRQLKERMEAERAMKERELLMEAHLKDARFKYLQAQINPHFLFNTLNAGAQLAMMEGADHTYEYVQKVAQFYRYNMKKGEESVTIGDEVELIDSYIYILNVRFSGDIHYEKRIDESLLHTPMPGMILQPIVENSVNHGIREMGDRGKIILSLYAVEDGICISIRDNGKGMKQETIDKILSGQYQRDPAKGDSNGIAMDNIISRLRLFTGNKDVMGISSDGKGKGTEVFLYLTDKKKRE